MALLHYPIINSSVDVQVKKNNKDHQPLSIKSEILILNIIKGILVLKMALNLLMA